MQKEIIKKNINTEYMEFVVYTNIFNDRVVVSCYFCGYSKNGHVGSTVVGG